MNSLEERNNDYGMLDVVLLINAENFFCIDYDARFNFGPSIFVTLPSLSCRATLKKTRIDLKLLTVLTWHFFMKKVLEDEKQEQFVIRHKEIINTWLW